MKLHGGPILESFLESSEIQTGQHCPLCSQPGLAVVLAGRDRSLMKCPTCSLVFLHPRPQQRELIDFFSSGYISTTDDVEVRFGTRPQKSHTQVAKFILDRKTAGTILDIGCAGGHFLDRYFKASTWKKWGIELSKFAAATAIRKSINVQVGTIQSVELPLCFFDVVTVLDTFYYFADPRDELSSIRRVLKPDGLLIIALPWAGSHIWRNTGWRRSFFPSSDRSLLEGTHIFFYTGHAIRSLLSSCCFRVIAMRPLPAIDQGAFLRNLVAGAYSAASTAAWHLSGARVMLGPRLLVAATPTIS